jgi:hypothetical protein
MASTVHSNTSRNIAFEAAVRLDALVRQDALDPYSRAILESAHSFLLEQDLIGRSKPSGDKDKSAKGQFCKFLA